MSYLHVSLADAPKDELREVVLDRFSHDYDFREDVVGKRNLDRAAELFEAKSGRGGEEAIPRVNLIRRSVEDLLSVAISNMPGCRLYATRDVSASVEDWERDLRMEVYNQSEVVMNALVRTALKKTQANDAEERAVTQAGVFGFGALFVGVDRSMSIRKEPMLRTLLSRESLTDDDIDRLHTMAHRLDVRDLDSRYVFTEAGKRHFRDCHRVSFIEHESKEVLRERYAETEYGNPKLIAPNRFGHRVDESNGNRSSDPDALTAVLTMFEIEEIEKERSVEGPGGEEMWIPFVDVRMTKVVMAGGEVVDREVTEGLPADDEDVEHGPLRLPVVFYHLHESFDSPYGVSLPLMLEVLEEYINSMRTLVYKMAKKGTAPGGVVIWEPNLAPGDLDEIEAVLDEGGVARVRGNGVNDVREMVMPMNVAAAPINVGMVQAMEVAGGDFRTMSQAPSPNEFSSARTGAAARARMQAADRSKGLSIVSLSRGKEDLYLTSYDVIRTYHRDRAEVVVELPGGGRATAVLNDAYRRLVLVQDDALRAPDNLMGFDVRAFETVLNATDTEFYAESDGRGNLPLDMISRVQLLGAMAQLGSIVPETVRQLGLDDHVREIDDLNRRRLQQDQQQMMAQMAAQQMTGAPGAPPAAGAGTAATAAPSAGGSFAGDVQSDFAEGPMQMVS